MHENLAAWLGELESRHTQEIQLGLQRIQTVAKYLDIQKNNTVVITVTGTNGKGSTVTALEAIYLAAGFSVGSYTSPHLLSFNERIRVNGKFISDTDLCSYFNLIEQRRAKVALTYFETVTLAALLYFQHHALDIIILEVGIGGRLDATNIMDADVSVITTVDLDHQEFLGDNIEAIAYEKAGIFRQNTYCIYGDVKPPLNIISEARRLNNQLLILNEDFNFQQMGDIFFLTYNANTIQLPLPKINLKAAATAIMASQCLQDKLPVSNEALQTAMQTVAIYGRQQVIYGDITIIFDVAHNPQAVRELARLVQDLQPSGNVHAVFSALKDKDISGLISIMGPLVDFWYPALVSGKRAMDAKALLKVFQDCINFQGQCFASPEMAYETAVQAAQPRDVIIVYGSFLTVGAVLKQHIK